MAMQGRGNFEIKPCPLIGPYNLQRFPQWSPEDSANWYMVKGENTKKPWAMYPTMGRAHINANGINQLVFGSEPRNIFKTINYAYVVEGNQIFQFDSQYNQVNITASQSLNSFSGPIYFTFLVVSATIYAVFVDDENVYIFQEGTPSIQVVTDPNCPGGSGSGLKPGFLAAFGNRITVSVANSSEFILSAVNLQGTGATNPAGYSFDPAKCFTNATTPQVFAQENGIIRQMGVLNNTLYIFTDYITGIWSNYPAVFSGTGVTFPWKKNSTYDWNFGIANSSSLDIDFGLMCFLARNSDGLLQFMSSSGGQPERISNKAVDTLLQNYTNTFGQDNPFLSSNSNGFLYQYENTIFYRMSGGNYTGNGILDQEQNANCIEYSFESGQWERGIEQNGERNRIQQHVFFNFKHWVTVVGEGTVYEMSGQYYYNETRNPAQSDPQASDAYIQNPFRYERVSSLIYEEDYSEFETEFVQVDFVWGDTLYLDLSTEVLYPPSLELFYSDDGGISYNSADQLEFSQLGVYSWRMRWYQVGCSRNRVYKLVGVSLYPIVILGSVMNKRRISGGAY
jgi:hypothetical protein